METCIDKTTSARVIQVVWPWKKKPSRGEGGDTPRPAWIRGAVQALVMGGIGSLVYRYGSHPGMAYAVWTLAGLVLASSLFIPPLFAAIERAGRKLGQWTGVGLTYLLLVPFFCIVFVPGRVVLKMLGKDPMQRSFPTPEPSCWTPRSSRMDDRHYRRQFS